MPQPPTDPDAALVSAARGGDLAAFEQLYRQHVGRVYALCLRMTADGAAADDLCQQAFVRAWEKLASFRGEAAFGSWLHRLTVNVILADRRAHQRRVVHLDPVRAPDDEVAIPRSGGTQLDLERAITRLLAGARTVFVLHDVEGLGHPEIARAMGISAGTSKGQLHRARQLLREVLS
ncbi:MAG: RNA polymerase sigma factor [Pseudomonadota bacterium]